MRLEVGKAYRHPNGYDCYVTDGCFFDPNFSRVSNWWGWRVINADGSLGRRYSGYGWKPVKKLKFKLIVQVD